MLDGSLIESPEYMRDRIIAQLDDRNIVENCIVGDVHFLITAGLDREKNIFAANCVMGALYNPGTDSFMFTDFSNTKSFPNDGKLYTWDEETEDYKEYGIDPSSSTYESE